jgi:hypothetical protein
LAIEVINCSADFLAATKRLLLSPIIYYLVLFGFFVFFLACLISVNAMAEISPDPHSGKRYIPFEKKLEWPNK